MDIGSAGEQIPSLDSQDSQYESDIKPDLMETSTNNGNSDGGPNQGQKRQAESDKNSGQGNQNQQKRMRTDTYNNGNNKLNGNKNIKCELRVLLPSKDAGAIIGRAGANIKKLRTEHKTIIQVPDCDGPERLLLVAGETETCLATILDVLPLLEEFNTGNATEFRLLVHQSQAGCIIGKSGDKIKELRLKHSLDMKVYSECAPMSTERICQMRGKSQDIVNCLGDVLALLETAPPKGMNRPYDPHNFNEFLSSQYGGYTSEKRQGMGGGGGGGGSGMGGGGGRGMGFGGRGGGRGGSLGGGSFNNGGGGNFGGGQGGGRGGFNQRGGGSFGGPSGGGGGGGFNQGLNDQNGSGGGGGGMGGGRGGGGMRGGGGFGQRAGNGNGMSRGGFSSRGRGGQTDMSRTGGRGGGGGGLGGGSSFVPRGGGRGGGLGGGSFGGQGGGGGGGGGGGFNAGGMGPNQGGGGGGGGGGFQQHHQSQSSLNASGQNPNAITNQVTIPNELAGAIIGPKGSKIQQIRESSGAGITIDKPISGSNDRIITITGTPEQIQNAQYLLQMTVKQSGLWHGQ